MLPTFLVIGSQKAGTTSIYQVLKKHPEVFMSPKKEINYFFFDHLYERGIDYYQEYFEGAEEKRVIGEASPGYICHPDSPGRIDETLGDIKLILSVRNPIDRAYSQYWDSRLNLEEPLTFEDAMQVSLEEKYKPGKRGYFSRGNYIFYINRFYKYFNKDKLKILFFEDLKNSPGKFYSSCFRFLEVNEKVEISNMRKKYNPATVRENPIYLYLLRNPSIVRYIPQAAKRIIRSIGQEKIFNYPPMRKNSKKILSDFYKDANENLAKLTGRDLDHWNNI